MKKWRMGRLCLEWYHSPGRDFGALGMVWSREPIYLAATVSIIDGNYSINEYSLRGLNEEERNSLINYLSTHITDSSNFQ